MLAWQLISLPRGIRNTASGGPRGPRCQHKKSVDLGKCWNSHSWWLFFVWHSDGFAWRFGGTPIPLDAYGCIMMHHDASSFSPWKMTKYVFSIFRYQPQIPHQVGYIYIYIYICIYIYTHVYPIIYPHECLMKSTCWSFKQHFQVQPDLPGRLSPMPGSSSRPWSNGWDGAWCISSSGCRWRAPTARVWTTLGDC